MMTLKTPLIFAPVVISEGVGSRFLAVLGMEDSAIIATIDAVLVAKLNQAQQVKELVATLAG